MWHVILMNTMYDQCGTGAGEGDGGCRRQSHEEQPKRVKPASHLHTSGVCVFV